MKKVFLLLLLTIAICSVAFGCSKKSEPQDLSDPAIPDIEWSDSDENP